MASACIDSTQFLRLLLATELGVIRPAVPPTWDPPPRDLPPPLADPLPPPPPAHFEFDDADDAGPPRRRAVFDSSSEVTSSTYRILARFRCCFWRMTSASKAGLSLIVFSSQMRGAPYRGAGFLDEGVIERSAWEGRHNVASMGKTMARWDYRNVPVVPLILWVSDSPALKPLLPVGTQPKLIHCASICTLSMTKVTREELAFTGKLCD